MDKELSRAWNKHFTVQINPLNAELKPIRHLLAFVGVRHIVHVSRIMVKHAVWISLIQIIGNNTSYIRQRSTSIKASYFIKLKIVSFI